MVSKRAKLQGAIDELAWELGRCVVFSVARKRKAICNAVIGLLMLLGSSIASGIQLHRKKTWTSTKGEIIGLERDKDDECHKPIIRYEANEKLLTFTSSICSRDPPSIGSSIAVLYHPDEPSKAMDASFTSVWLFPIVFGGIGLSLFLYSSITLCCSEKSGDRAPSTNGTHQSRPPSNNDETYAKEPSTNPCYRPNNEVTLAMKTYNNPPTQTLEQRLEVPSTHATTSFDAYQGGIEDEPEIFVPGRY